MKWGSSDPNAIALYREQTVASVQISFRRKHCACGKMVTAKQLVQYGACTACARAAAATRKVA